MSGKEKGEMENYLLYGSDLYGYHCPVTRTGIVTVLWVSGFF